MSDVANSISADLAQNRGADVEIELPSVMVNGENTRLLDIADRGLSYGDGVFTTLCMQQGIPLFLDRHLARLQGDASRLSIPFPGLEVLSAEARKLAALNPEGILKIILTRGIGGRGYRCPQQPKGTRILSVHPKPDHPPANQASGVRARFCATRLGFNPRLAGIKHLNRLEQVIARAEWEDDGIGEGLLLDQDGSVVEGIASNVFLVCGGALRTPLLDRCGVAGTMRKLVMEAAQGLGITVEQARIPPEAALTADEIFVTNSVIGLWPVNQLNGKRFSVGGTTRLLARRIQQLSLAELASGQTGLNPGSPT